MNPIDIAVMFFSSFAVVFLLGLQSRNVVAGRYLAAVVTSAGINLAQFVFVKYVATGRDGVLLVTTLGGCCGIAFAIWFYSHVMNRKNKPQHEPVLAHVNDCGVCKPGWYCSREKGHDGPCAAWPISHETNAV